MCLCAGSGMYVISQKAFLSLAYIYAPLCYSLSYTVYTSHSSSLLSLSLLLYTPVC